MNASLFKRATMADPVQDTCMSRAEQLPKILVLTSTYPRWEKDWEPRFVFDLCRRLARDFQVHVLAPHFPGSAREEILEGTRVTRYRYFFWERGQTITYDGGILNRLRKNPFRFGLVPFFLFFQVVAARRLMKQHDFIALHAHWIIPQGLVAVLAQWGRPRIPVLCTSHGGDLFGLGGRFLERIKRWVMTRCRCVTVVSQAMGGEANRLAPLTPTRIIPMGTDLKSLFCPNGTERSSSTILFVGRLVDKKGVPQLLEAFAKVKKRHPSAQLCIAGWGPEEPVLRKQVEAMDRKWLGEDGIFSGKKESLGESIHFRGAVPHHDLPDFYRRATVTVVPSIQEGFGLVIVEALGCASPVVASSLPAIKDILQDGVTGLLAHPGDVNHLAAQICRLLENEDERASLARKGREHVAARFDWEAIAESYKNLLLKLNGTTALRQGRTSVLQGQQTIRNASNSDMTTRIRF